MIDTIILCYEYYGSSSTNPNAVCLYNLIRNLENKDRFLILTTSTNRDNCDRICEIEQISLLKIYIKEGDSKQRLVKFQKNVVKIFPQLADKFNIKNILGLTFPFKVAEIAYEIKKKYADINFLLYSLDPYSYNDALRFRKLLWLYRFNKEKKIFKTADKILLTYELYEFYKSTPFNYYHMKFIETGIPILNIKGSDFYGDVEIKNDSIKIIYAGSISLKYRDPNYILDLFIELKNKLDFKIYFYGSDHLQISDNIKKSLGNRLCILPVVDKRKLAQIFKEANFLLNIGNTMDNQLPSKIIEYIGFRKPIINLLYSDKDPSIKYLEKYPFHLNINRVSNRNDNIVNLYSYICQNKYKLCDQLYIEETYAYLSPLNISSKILLELK